MQKHARGGAGGARKSRALGSSAEFSDFRPYAPGDDIRRIDWNAYARFNRLFLKLFMEEQETTLTMILDSSASMAAKWTRAVELSQALCYLALRGGDRVTVVTLGGGGANRSRLFTGRAGYAGAAAFLEDARPAGAAALSEALPRLQLRPRGLYALLSDLLEEDEGERALSALAYLGGQATLFHLLSPEELRPDYDGALRLIDAESRAHIDLMAGRECLEAYRASLTEFLEAARRRCFRLGIHWALMDAGRPLMDLILHSGSVEI